MKTKFLILLLVLSLTGFSQVIKSNVYTYNPSGNQVTDKQDGEVVLPPVLSFDKIEVSSGLLEAGKSIEVKVKIKNSGPGTGKDVYLNVKTNFDEYLNYQKKIHLPDIAAQGGEVEKTFTIYGKETLPDGKLQVDLQVIEPHFNVKIQGKRITINTEKLKEPQLAIVKVVPQELYSASPNKMIDKNEMIGVEFYLQNLGLGEAKNVKVNVKPEVRGVQFIGYKNENGGVSKEIPVFSDLPPGKYVKVFAQFFINTEFNSDSLRLSINVSETKNKYGINVIKSFSVNSQLSETGNVLVVKDETQKEDQVQIEDIPESESDLLYVEKNNETKENRFALIIGVENYKNFSKTKYSLNDASLIKIYMSAIIGVPAKNIYYLEDPLFDDLNIEGSGEIYRLYNRLNSKSELFIYYSGHSLPDEETQSPLILPVNAYINTRKIEEQHLSADQYYQAIENAISLQELLDFFNEKSPKQITVFLDACFSGKRGEEALSQYARSVIITVAKFIVPRNTVILTAVKGNQTAYPYETVHHGLFTYALAKTLQETGGQITFSDLYNSIKEKMVEISNLPNSKIPPQEPDIMYENENLIKKKIY